MNLNEMKNRMEEIKGWGIEGNAIIKEFEFKDFKETMVLVNKIAEISEKLGHHPSMLVDYSRLRVTLITHGEKTITDKDFELAKEIDKLAGDKLLT